LSSSTRSTPPEPYVAHAANSNTERRKPLLCRTFRLTDLRRSAVVGELARTVDDRHRQWLQAISSDLGDDVASPVRGDHQVPPGDLARER